eukprot:5727883-Prorocentrum_lima.AAC.1
MPSRLPSSKGVCSPPELGVSAAVEVREPQCSCLWALPGPPRIALGRCVWCVCVLWGSALSGGAPCGGTPSQCGGGK